MLFYYKVLVTKKLPSDKFSENKLTYSAKENIDIGTIVKISIQTKKNLGIVTEKVTKEITEKYKNKINPIEEIFPYKISVKNLKFLFKFANYNCIKIHQVISMTLPKVLQKELLNKNNITIKNPKLTNKNNNSNIKLSTEQLDIVNKLYSIISNQSYSTTLLYGIVGSGKTIIYLNCIKKILQNKPNAQILILIPEIALIPQTAEYLQKITEKKAILWYSGISNKTKNIIQIINGSANLIIGSRSALLLPYKNLKAIIVDEEHDSSYKQESNILYNARNMAVLKGNIENFPIILCSATPSIESFYNTDINKYKKIEINKRPYSNIPNTRAIKITQNKKLLELETIIEIKKTIDAEKQVMLFMNKRGWRTILKCSQCSDTIQCPDCSMHVTIHKNEKEQSYSLKCHQCSKIIKNYIDITELECKKCLKKNTFISYGARIQALVEEVENVFPEKNVLLITSDTIKTNSKKKEWAKEKTKNTAQIIIGTQIIAKGHNFPNLHLVVLIDGDIQASEGNFKATEKFYQLAHQAIGRAGRFYNQGLAIIQTYNPESNFTKALLAMDYKIFYNSEINMRKKYNKPPFIKCVKFTVACIKEQDSLNIIHKLFNSVKKLVITPNHIQEPQKSPIFKIEKKYKYQIILYTNDDKLIKKIAKIFNEEIEKINQNLKKINKCKLITDRDPDNFY